MIFDTAKRTTTALEDLKAAGVTALIRYYARQTQLPEKRLTDSECKAILATGLDLVIVFEVGDTAGYFSEEKGKLDGGYALSQAQSGIQQPAGSYIYFAVDYDASREQIQSNILPYFKGVRDGLANGAGTPPFGIGVYGSGLTCQTLLDAGSATKAWLAQSKGWAGYSDFKTSMKWSICQGPEATIAGIGGDTDIANKAIPYGGFLPTSGMPDAVTQAAPARTLTVMARSGLNVRSGPDTTYGIVKSLPFGKTVTAIKPVGDWLMVDTEGDGKADGFVISHYLQ